MIQQFNSGIYPKPMKLSLKKMLAPWCSLQRYLQSLRHSRKGNNLSSSEEELTRNVILYIYVCVYYVFITYIYKLSHIFPSCLPEKQMKFCHFGTTRTRPWEHYTKWNKSEKKRQRPYDITYRWDLKKKNNNKLVVARGGVGGWAKYVKVVKMYTFPVIRKVNSVM